MTKRCVREHHRVALFRALEKGGILPEAIDLYRKAVEAGDALAGRGS
jgi:hypothetical protein